VGLTKAGEEGDASMLGQLEGKRSSLQGRHRSSHARTKHRDIEAQHHCGKHRHVHRTDGVRRLPRAPPIHPAPKHKHH
jgi:hypothetical protein